MVIEYIIIAFAFALATLITTHIPAAINADPDSLGYIISTSIFYVIIVTVVMPFLLHNYITSERTTIFINSYKDRLYEVHNKNEEK